LELARELVETVKPENNRYEFTGPEGVHWDGTWFNKERSVNTHCTGFVGAVLNKAGSNAVQLIESINRAARASAEPKPEPVVVNFVDATSMFDCNYMDRQTIERDFKVLATENEACTHVLIDISQDMQAEYARIEKTHQTLIELVESIKQSLVPKKTWLGKEIPVDIAEVNRLIDSAQAFVKEPFKIDFFLTSRIQEAFDKSQRCDAKIAKLEKSMEHAIRHGGAQNDDPLYKRIVTARKMIELQNMSTQKSLTLLGGAYDKIEDFRQNSLVIVLIDAQSKLIK
jgi:hypothetical protein